MYIYIRIHSEFKRRNVIDMLDNNTRFFKTQPDKTISVEEILEQVYLALKEKGYNPVNQIVGYIMSGDPTYITSHNNARSLIMKVERDELCIFFFLILQRPLLPVFLSSPYQGLHIPAPCVPQDIFSPLQLQHNQLMP